MGDPRFRLGRGRAGLRRGVRRRRELRIVYRGTLGISALAQLLAVLFLGYHFGVVGAILAIPLRAATAQIVTRAVRSCAAANQVARGAARRQDSSPPPTRPPREAPAE